MRRAADAAAARAASAAGAAGAAARGAGAGAALAAYAAYAAANAARAVYVAGAAASANAADAAAGAAASANAAAESWWAVSLDAAWLEANPEGRLIDQPLWLDDVRGDDRYKANLPPWVRSAFDEFVGSDGAKRHGFAPWIAWYRALIPNRAGAAPHDHFGEALTLRIAGQPKEWWARPPEDVNADIAAWLEERPSDPEPDPEFGEDLETALANLPAQTPAAYRFRWRDDRITAEPPDPSPGDSAVAQDLLDEARRKAEALCARLERSNADPYARQSVRGLLDSLPGAAGEVRAGLLLSRARSVLAVADAYAGPDEERELFPGAIAQILDLSETVRDLQGCFPEIRDIEGERMALAIDPAEVDAIGGHLDTIVAQAVADDAVVDESAKEALETISDNADQDAPREVKQRLVADRLLVVRNFLSPLFRFALASSFATEARGVTREVWEKARPKLIEGAADGLGSMGRPVVVVGVSALVWGLLGPVAGLATAAAGFGKIDQLVKLLHKRLERRRPPADAESDDDEEEEEDETDDGPRGPATE
eukprot:g584.t1